MTDEPESPLPPNPLKPGSMTAAQMSAITQLHAQLEQEGKYEPLLETVCEDPIYEFHPPGGRLCGLDVIRDYYTRFLDEFMPLVEEVHFIGEWTTPEACVHEYQLGLRIDGEIEYHQVMGAIYGSGDRIGGERLYGTEKLMDLMLGPFKSQLTPIEEPSFFATATIELPPKSR